MADEKETEAKAEQESGDEKKKLPLKTIIVVLVMMIGEAGAILAVVSMMGQPSPVQGVTIETDPGAQDEELHEVPILHEKFANNATGRLWYWDTEVLIQTRQKHLERVSAELERRAAEIRTGVGAVMAGAQHSYFNEPGRETLSRQLLEYLRGQLGQDEEGEELVVGVLIPKCIGFPADY